MKRRILAILGAMLVSVSVLFAPAHEVKAAKVTGLKEQISVGEMISQTRGQYLQTGSSSLGKVGSGKIHVVGTTIAQKVVSTVKVSVMVERKINGNWASYTSWSATKNNTYTVSSSKTLTVPKGYYYRVRCIHSANSDVGSSNTNALYID